MKYPSSAGKKLSESDDHGARQQRKTSSPPRILNVSETTVVRSSGEGFDQDKYGSELFTPLSCGRPGARDVINARGFHALEPLMSRLVQVRRSRVRLPQERQPSGMQHGGPEPKLAEPLHALWLAR